MAKFFSKQDIRGLLQFLPLAAIGIAALMLAQPKNDPDKALRVEQKADSLGFGPKRKYADKAPANKTLRLRPFDPNTVTYEELLEIGLDRWQAETFINYRAAGTIFRKPEQVARCYAIDSSLYRQLEPYIKIKPRYKKAPENYRPGRIVKATIAPIPFRIDTVSGRYLQAIGALTEKQARTFNNYRKWYVIRNMEDFRKCYAISDSVAAALEPYMRFPEAQTDEDRPVNLNTADSAELRSVTGIGEKTVMAILAYRERLGGFVCVEQLAEVQGMTESNYEKIVQQIYCDSCEIRKIDINFADPKDLVAQNHPYFNSKIIRRLSSRKKLEGGWRTVEELIENEIMTRKEAARLAPYLVFNRNGGTDDTTKRIETDGASEDAAPAGKTNESIKN